MKFTNSIYSLIVFLIFLSGCATLQPKSIPSIVKAEGWRIEEVCGSEGCYPLVDYLMHQDDLAIRVEALNGRGYVNIFTIQIQMGSDQANLLI